jgi:hypothetical protein
MAGFNQTQILETEQHKTAFHGPTQLMMYTRAPFGLKRMPNWFQREMEHIVSNSALVFIDDVLTGNSVAADYSDFSQHVLVVKKMLLRLIMYGVTFNPEKCHFAKRQVKFLGHGLSGGKVQMERGKVDAMLVIPRPTNRAEVLSWVHTVGYYSKLIDHFSSRAEPLTRLLKKDVPFVWDAEQESSWLDLRDAMVKDPVLALPDRSLAFILSTDWSNKGMSAVLSQMGVDAAERVIAYASRTNSVSEKNYASYKGEMCAAVWGVDHFRYWLTGRPFKLVTDHQPLAFLMKSQKLTGLYFRWAARLSEFDIEIVYRPGSANVADLTSRFPLPDVDADWENFKQEVDYLAAERPVVAFVQALHVALDTGGAEEADFEPVLRPGLELGLDQGLDAAVVYQLALANVTTQQWPDVWDDERVLRFLQTAYIEPLLSRAARHRIRQRAKVYVWCAATEQLFKKRRGAELRQLVPPPAARADLVRQAHVDMGHSAVRRLLGAMYRKYWWHDMSVMVADECRSCRACSQANTVFTAKNPELMTLPLEPGFHRVHIDLCGPFVESTKGMKYVMVIVDSFTKWVVFEPLVDKSAQSTSAGFRDSWVTVYGAPGYLVADNGAEWLGEFEQLLAESGIRRRYTSPNHPQANGLAERMVGACKRGLSKYVAALSDPKEWCSTLQYVAMAHRFAPLGSLRMSPYRMVFGCDPVLPFRTQQVFLEAERDTTGVDVVVWLSRKVAALARMTPIAMGNLQAANERNEEQYRVTRSGNYMRKTNWWVAGELAYVMRRNDAAALEPKAAHVIFRVVQVRPSGILVMQGRCGGTFRENGSNCGPCWLSHVDASVDPELALARFNSTDPATTACEKCDKQDSSADRDRPGEVMLICSLCYTGWHLSCAEVGVMPLKEEDWYCPYCVQFRSRATQVMAVRVAERGRLHSADALRAELERYMPGVWPESTVTRLAKFLPGQADFLQPATGKPECVVTLAEEYECLLRAIDFGSLLALVDPFAGSGTTRRVMEPATGVSVVLSDIFPWSGELQLYNALEARDMRQLTAGLSPGTWAFVTSPWFKFNDLALPVMMEAGPAAVFAHVSHHYVFDSHERRKKWMEQYDVHVILIEMRGNVGRHCVWLCLFPKGTKQRFLRVATTASMSWTL